MTIAFHLLDAMDEIPAPLRDGIMAELKAAHERVSRLLQLDRLDIVVAPEAWAMPAYGFNGYANSPGRISITFKPDSPRLHDPERAERILGTLAHEMHHVLRMRRGAEPESYTLGSRFVSEGLAQCSEEEAGAPTPFYAVALNDDTLTMMAERARPLLSATDFAHDDWMFGRRNDPAWPISAGYSVGYALVKAWLSKKGTSALEAAGVSATEITDDWLADDVTLWSAEG